MLLNSILAAFQNLLRPVYEKSFFLQNIDVLIGLNIFLAIAASTFAQSDNIGYFVIFAIILTALKVVTKPESQFKMTTADKFLLVYFLFVLISVAGSSLFYLSLKGFSKTFIYLGFYISFVHYIKEDKNRIKYVLLALAFAAFGESLIAIKQNFLSVSEISGWQDMSRLNPEEVMTRVYGTLKPYNPNLFGGYMLASLPSTLSLVYLGFINKNFKCSLLGLICCIFTAAAIVLTGCRGAYIGFFAQLIVLALFIYKFLKPQLKKLFLIICALFSAMAFFIISSILALRARIFSIFAMRSDSSNSFRFNVYNSCIDMFKDNWLLGIGVGNQNFREIYGLYMKTGFDALSAYNIYLELAVESGIFALLAFIGFLVSNILSAVKYVFKNNNENVIYIIIALLSLIGILVHGIVDTVFFRPQIQFVFWIMVGIIRVITFEKEI